MAPWFAVHSLLLCRLKSQIPQITQTLEILRHMQKKKVRISAQVGVPILLKVFFLPRHFSKRLPFCSQDTTEPMETHFLLADNVYCKASVPPTNKVCLWLGVSPTQTFNLFSFSSVFVCSFVFHLTRLLVLIVGLRNIRLLSF